MSSGRQEKHRRREERLARQAAEERAAVRRRRLQMAGGVVAVVAVAAIVVALLATGEHARSSTTRPSGSGLLASTAGEAYGATVDGIRCQTNEQAIFHIHAHLAIYVNGRQRAVPEGIGIPPPRSLQQSSEGPFRRVRRLLLLAAQPHA